MERLRHIREQSGYSQQDLADESGVSQHTISEIELGRRRPQGRTLRKLAKVLGVEVADLFGEAGYPLGEAPPSPQLTLNGALEEERHAADAAVIANYERIVREHRIAWRDALNALAKPWEARLRTGDFDRSAVEQFFADVAAISESVSRALYTSHTEDRLRQEYKGLPTSQEERAEAWESAISPAGAVLLDLCDEVYAAAVEKFSQSELVAVRQKHDEARRALGRAA